MEVEACNHERLERDEVIRKTCVAAVPEAMLLFLVLFVCMHASLSLSLSSLPVTAL